MWEYEGVFDAVLDPEGRPLGYEYWRNLPPEVQFGRMGYRTRTTLAGQRLEAEVFPIFGRTETGKLRAARKNLSREAQQRLNQERSTRRLIQLMETNFTERDVHVTLSYEGQEPDLKRTKKDVRNFLLRLKRVWSRKAEEARAEGRSWPEMKYIYAIGGDEMPSKGYSGKRPHVHMTLTGGISEKELIEIWDRGIVKSSQLQPNEEGLEGLSKYFTKQRFDRPPTKNAKMWSGSRNLKQPKVRTSNAKCSNARVMRIAYDYRNEAKEVMEKIYPGYRFVKCSVYHSDVVRGVYIRAVMRKLT